MRWIGYLFLMSASLLLVMGGVKECQASSLADWKYQQYFLDKGFMGREVDLNLPDLSLDIFFNATDIPYPGVLHVLTTPTNTVTSTLGYRRFGPDYQLQWTTNAPQKPEIALVRLDNTACGQGSWHCAIEQTYQGQTTLLKPGRVISGSAQVKVKLGATIRLVQVEGWMSEGYASWYAYKNCPCAASPDFSKGSYVKVIRVSDPSKTLVVRINDYGPDRSIFPERVIDLDKTAFAALAPLGAGVMQVRVEPMPADYTPEPITNQQVAITQPKEVVPEEPKSGWEL